MRKGFVVFVVFGFLLTASCLFRKPESTINQTISKEEFEKVKKELDKLKEEYGLKIEDLFRDIEGIKRFIALMESQKKDTLSRKDIRPFIPDKVFFCGEEVPLDRFQVRERLESAIITELMRPGFILVFLRSGRWFPLIENKAKETSLPEDSKYVAVIESDLNPFAYSYAGAAGLWQFIRDTGKRYLKISSYVDERLDPEKSTEAALKHLKELYIEFGDWPSVLAGYNMHKDRYKKEKLKEKAVDFYAVKDIPTESLQYPFRAIAAKLIMEYPDKYGFPPIEEINKIKYVPYQTDAIIVNVTKKTEKIVDIAQRLGMTYQEFRCLNPHILIKKNSYGEVVRDYLPKGKYRLYIFKKAIN